MLDFGIEIECLIPGQSGMYTSVATGIADIITATGLACRYASYTHTGISPWKIVTDSSISAPPGYVGLEIVSPPLSDDGLGQIDTIGRILNEAGARVNKTCGLHVHIGARALPFSALKRLAWLYHDYEESIDGLLPPSRRQSNLYCRGLKGNTNLQRLEEARDVQGIQNAINAGSRYVKLNFAAFWKFGTVEFRQHSGTVDPVKITKWVLFCSRMVELARKEQNASRVVPVNTQEWKRQSRIIFETVGRPEGATAIEVQAALNRRSPPDLPLRLTNIGVPFSVSGRRNGRKVYKLNLAMQQPEDTTLPTLLSKLEMPVEDVEFWNARAALLSGSISPSESESH